MMLYSLAGPTAERPEPHELVHPSEEDQADFFRRLGEAVAAWAKLEEMLSLFYGTTLGVYDKRSAFGALSVVTSFRTRLEMIDAAVAVCPMQAGQRKTWEKLRDRCRKKSLSRNHLAHGRILFMYPEHKLVIASAVHDPRKPNVHKPIDVKEITDLKTSFITLTRDVGAFWQSTLAEFPNLETPQKDR